MLDHEKKLEREKKEVATKKAKVGETLNILSWQVDSRKTA